jgi:hypothetical protein
VSSVGDRRTCVGGAGGMVSIVTDNAPDLELTVPAASVAMAVML